MLASAQVAEYYLLLRILAFLLPSEYLPIFDAVDFFRIGILRVENQTMATTHPSFKTFSS